MSIIKFIDNSDYDVAAVDSRLITHIVSFNEGMAAAIYLAGVDKPVLVHVPFIKALKAWAEVYRDTE